MSRTALRGALLATALALCSVAVQPAPAQGRFYGVVREEGVWWLTAPGGERFFSLGVNVIDPGTTREKYRPDRPEYAAFRHYPDTAAWARATLARLRAWNFNTIGAWADREALAQAGEPGLPYTIGLWVGSENGVPWLDLFSEATERRFDEVVRRQVIPLKDDPRLIGYFTDNELGWWDETIFHYHLQQPANATRKVLLGLLREHYRGDFARLRRDFDPGEARSFADLERPAHLWLQPGGDGRAVVEAFTALLAERYYRLSHDAIRRHDPNHLILGDRYISWYPPVVARAARRYVDVVSSNYNADWKDGGIARFHFDSLYRITGRPVMVTEYYLAAMENRSGNPNSSAGFPTVATQRERAAAFRRSLAEFAELPYVVGAHWFQYYDEPTHGRTDGEDFNMGLVDIHDRPYEELTASAAELQARVPALHARARPMAEPEAGGESEPPPAPERPADGLHRWDRRRALVPAAVALPAADLYATWDRDQLYLAAHAADFADAKLQPGGEVPTKHRMSWVVRVDGRGPVAVRFGPGGPSTVEGPGRLAGEWARNSRFTGMIAVSATLIGRKALQSGDRLRLQATWTPRGGGPPTTWNRTLQLGAPRSDRVME